jgi:hypothetical protein
MSELQNPETGRPKRPYFSPAVLNRKTSRRRLTFPSTRWRQFREGPPLVELGRKVYYRKESVTARVLSSPGRSPETQDRVTLRQGLRG